ncbi:hypothetical protein MmiHf6_10970 [Methanimicrococcus hongohii]|uniref:Uncharacterized protein n=1 Tax=Methanimicrococcus hongohii TaxID=3028295 RepID=A0AA96ZUH7_9EURY|nr:hypothetical protein [Methanimicrococcus sp. Hf6]WNY23782.1 hypothetical protein MmiHf6_10970 [Methanimicrococcus sp. Hf6]
MDEIKILKYEIKTRGRFEKQKKWGSSRAAAVWSGSSANRIANGNGILLVAAANRNLWATAARSRMRTDYD